MSRGLVGLWPRWSAIALSAGLLGLVGCAGGTGDLSGTVTFKDKPVQVGTVLVASDDGSILSGPIQDDGTYFITKIPAGVVKVAVNSPDPRTVKVTTRNKGEKEKEKAPTADASKWVAIPENYADHNKSELTTTIKGGPNVFNIELK